MPDHGHGTFVYVPNTAMSTDIPQAGAVIVQEAGGFFSGGKEAFEQNAPVGDVIIGRRYVAVRPVAATEVGIPPSALASTHLHQTETAEQIQRRIVKELYENVTSWKNSDMP
jgi:myo-inositol-1(or 4)-monophosphatase